MELSNPQLSAQKKLKLEKAFTLLRSQKITYRKAAALAGLSYVGIIDKISGEGIPIGYTLKELHKDIRGLKSITSSSPS